MLVHNKDDIEFVTEFPCLLGHSVDTVPLTNTFFLIIVSKEDAL